MSSSDTIWVKNKWPIPSLTLCPHVQCFLSLIIITFPLTNNQYCPYIIKKSVFSMSSGNFPITVQVAANILEVPTTCQAEYSHSVLICYHSPALLGQALLLSPVFKWDYWGLEALSCLKAIQLLIRRTETWVQNHAAKTWALNLWTPLPVSIKTYTSLSLISTSEEAAVLGHFQYW